MSTHNSAPITFISGEMTVRHVAHSRNKRRERSDNRYKTGENNRFAAMSLRKTDESYR